MNQKINWRFVTLGLVLFCAGMAAAAVWDLDISKALYHPGNPVAVAMECFGYYPLYTMPVALLLIMAACTQERTRRILCYMGATLGGLVLAANSTMELIARGAALPRAALLSAGVWVLLATAWRMLLRNCEKSLNRLNFVFRWGTGYAAACLLVINILKGIWNRTRFDDMLAAGSFDAFTPWLRPFGNGGTSFPSGHTAAACAVLVLVLLCDVFVSWKPRRTAVWGVCWLYIAGMALTRIVMGRHFLSDTLMAAAVCTTLFLLMTHTKLYAEALDRLRV